LNHHARTIRTKRLGLVAALSLICLAVAPVARADWLSAGNSYVRAQAENTFACSDGIQARLAAHPVGFLSQQTFAAFYASHPWDWTRIKVTDEQALHPDTVVPFADEVIPLPRNPVDTGTPFSAGMPGSNIFAYSAEVQIRYNTALSGQVQMWPYIETTLLGPLGQPLQIPADGCTLPPLPAGDGCLGGRDPITGTRGDDHIVGTPGDDVIVGLGGNDSIAGLGGDDRICGGAGADFIYGGTGNDGLDGDIGADVLVDGSGNNLLLGGAGADVLSGGAGDDILKGQADNDILVGGPFFEVQGFDPLDGGPGTDLCLQAEVEVACEF
jgi:RTX calcium-binding nonapeptide repeat (4 copies)